MLKSFYSVPLWITRWPETSPPIQRLQELATTQTWQTHPEWRTHHLSDPSFETNCLQGEDIVQASIRAEAARFWEAVGREPEELAITEAWMTNTHKGEYAHVHDHKNNTLSGVIYVQSTRDTGDLFFPHPHPILHHTPWLEHWPDHYTVAPETGTVVLFPSWLQHGTRTNTTDHTRISLSVNLQAACG